MKARRIVSIIAVAALPLMGALSSAGAAPPKAGCPPVFEGPLTFQQVLDEFPPPPEIPDEDAIAALNFYDKNDDDMVCVQDNPAPGINVVDNAANVP